MSQVGVDLKNSRFLYVMYNRKLIVAHALLVGTSGSKLLRNGIDRKGFGTM